MLGCTEIAISMLLFHGTTDALVSVVLIDLYAQTHLNFVTSLRAEGVDHALRWNAHPHAYEETLTLFLCSPTELMSK